VEKELNKNELKTIVKECLLEILLDGMNDTSKQIKEGGTRRPPDRRPVENVTEKKRSHLDTVTYAQRPAASLKPPTERRPPPPPVLKERYRDLANGNDVMASIFADTASSTLQKQREASTVDREGANPVVDTGVDPSLMEGSNNWAHLAFASKRPGDRSE
jgi:hypothetical protein